MQIQAGAVVYTVVHELGHCVNIPHHTSKGTGLGEQNFAVETAKKFPGHSFFLAKRGGLFSGDRWCPMRYRGPSYYTDGVGIYHWDDDSLVNVAEDALVPAGPRPADDDFQLGSFCSSAAGTDFNASDHKPRPRAGDCGEHGNCMGQIQVRDNDDT